MVRDFVKWDDTPNSLQHFAESAVRAYKTAMTPPTLPVLLVADLGLQEAAIKDEKFDLIFTGLQSDDYGYAQTGVDLTLERIRRKPREYTGTGRPAVASAATVGEQKRVGSRVQPISLRKDSRPLSSSVPIFSSEQRVE